MAKSRFSSLGVVSSMALAAALGCAGLLGIEDATCDESFDPSCAEAPDAFGGAAGTGGSGLGGNSAGGNAAGGVAAGGNGPTAGTGGALQAGGSGGAAAGAGGSATVEAPLCERYCNTVAAACTGENEQYASIGACLNVCALLEPGADGAFMGNNVECRLSRAELAQATGEPASYCFSAGPGGAGVCGSDCEGFCAIMAQTCTLMGTFDACLPQCAQVPDLSKESDDVKYNTSMQSGDSLQCRLYHVTAATLDAVTHCSHAAGVALCSDPQ
jgi:hypothetical protein